MNENYNETNYEELRAEIAALNHEIYELNTIIDRQNKEFSEAVSINRFDPFNNPTEYKGFSGDYAKIVPDILEPGCSLPLEPKGKERKNLKKFYSIGGRFILLKFLLTTGISLVLMFVFGKFLSSGIENADMTNIKHYLNTSSISAAVNLLVTMLFTVLAAFLGLRSAGIKMSPLVRTKDLGLGSVIKYCLISLMIWALSIYLSSLVNVILSDHGISGGSFIPGSTTKSSIGLAVMLIYQCIIAPVTDELFYRGFILRVFSKANQRFAVFASAIFCALGQRNLTQLIVALLTGLFLAHITLKHGSVIPAMIVHIFINTLTVGFNYAMNLGSTVVFITEMVLMACGIIGLIAFLVFIDSDKIPLSTPAQSRRGLPLASTDLMIILAFSAQLIYIVYTTLHS